MILKKSKLLFYLGGIVTLTAPPLAIVSCGKKKVIALSKSKQYHAAKIALFDVLASHLFNKGKPQIIYKEEIKPQFLGVELTSLTGGIALSALNANQKAIILDQAASKITQVKIKPNDVTKFLVTINFNGKQENITVPATYNQEQHSYRSFFKTQAAKVALYDAIVQAKTGAYNPGKSQKIGQGELSPTFLGKTIATIAGGKTDLSALNKATIIDAVASKITRIDAKAGDHSKTIVTITGLTPTQVELAQPFNKTHQTYSGAFKSQSAKQTLFNSIIIFNSQTYNAGSPQVLGQGLVQPSLAGITLELEGGIDVQKLLPQQKVDAIDKVLHLVTNLKLGKKGKTIITIKGKEYLVKIPFKGSKLKTFGIK